MKISVRVVALFNVTRNLI